MDKTVSAEQQPADSTTDLSDESSEEEESEEEEEVDSEWTTRRLQQRAREDALEGSTLAHLNSKKVHKVKAGGRTFICGRTVSYMYEQTTMPSEEAMRCLDCFRAVP
eukprot:590753-Karenia_brevis.AAC.1